MTTRPREGWIYMLAPTQLYQLCRAGHHYSYDITPSLMPCKHPGCTQQVNPSTILRGVHPHIIASLKVEAAGLAQVIPMSSSDRDAGLPTTYPIKATTKNGLDKHSFALVHQITTLDLHALRQPDGSWKERMGQLDKRDKDALQERIAFLLDLQPEDDWFLDRMTFNLAERALERLSPEDRQRLLERQLDKL